MAIAFCQAVLSYEVGAALHRNHIWLDSPQRRAKVTIVIDIVIGDRMAALGG
jgi:hypothetical protein